MLRHKIDVALLQESHLPASRVTHIRHLFRGLLHASGFTTHARGVITWVNPKTQLTLEELFTDANGRYTISRCKGRGLDVLLLNIYGPNYDCPQFIHDFNILARQLPELPIVWGGDFNCTLNPTIDRSGGPLRRPSQTAEAILLAQTELGLFDAWRSFNPNLGGYTHHSTPHDLHTRIDY